MISILRAGSYYKRQCYIEDSFKSIDVNSKRKTDKLVLEKSMSGPSSKEIRSKVQLARNIQTKRFKKENQSTGRQIISNSEMNSKLIKKYCIIKLNTNINIIDFISSIYINND